MIALAGLAPTDIAATAMVATAASTLIRRSRVHLAPVTCKPV
jgi:hypothetical protein